MATSTATPTSATTPDSEFSRPCRVLLEALYEAKGIGSDPAQRLEFWRKFSPSFFSVTTDEDELKAREYYFLLVNLKIENI